MAAPTERKIKRGSGSRIAPANNIRHDSAKESARQEERDSMPVWEWIVAGVGCVLVATVIGFLLHEALLGNRHPPDIKLSVSSVIRTGNGYLVQITAENQGSTTAEGVVLGGELRSGPEIVEQSHTTIEYLPPRSKKRAGLFFTRNPRDYELRVRPLGYEDP
jgi:uncharacterized protein (TIGR02588 family)